jgi:hypothetical protein
VDLPPLQVSTGTVVLGGLALGAAIAIVTGLGGRAGREDRRTEELARLAPPTSDDVAPGAPEGDGAGERAGDVSLLAQTLNESASEIDAR